MAVSFNTSPINNGTEYQIVDTSTNISSFYEKKIVLAGANGNPFYTRDNIPLSENIITIPVNTQLWFQQLALVQLQVSLIYKEQTGGSETVAQVYLLPTSLNIKQ